jgi:hypothetical protein
MATDINPKVFISYSRDDKDHSQWVNRLADRLQADGIDVRLDIWKASPGDPLPEFMERAIRENDFVLIICTPQYKKKSDNRLGGVGYESHVMAAQLFVKRNHPKFIPILRQGKWEEAAPDWLLGAVYIDLSGEGGDDSAYQELLDTLSMRRQQAPPLGKLPLNSKSYLIDKLGDGRTDRAEKADVAPPNKRLRDLDGFVLGEAGPSERIRSSRILFSIEEQLKEPLEQLTSAAEEALFKLSRMFDNYDQREDARKSLNHIFFDFCQAVSSVLCSQILRQTSVALHRRLRALADVEADINDIERLSGSLNFVMYNYHDPEPKGFFKLFLKGAPVKGHDLANNIATIYQHIPKTRIKDIFADGLNRCHDFSRQHLEILPAIKESLGHLRTRMKIDGYFEHESKMSRDLYKKYVDAVTKLEFLEGCSTPSVEGSGNKWIPKSLSGLTYIGVTLSLVSDYNDWGRDIMPI